MNVRGLAGNDWRYYILFFRAAKKLSAMALSQSPRRIAVAERRTDLARSR